MKKTVAPNYTLDPRKLRGWANVFNNYWHAVPEQSIRDWLQQFNKRAPLGVKILDKVNFITHDQISAAYKSILSSLDGWNRDPTKRSGKWRFIAFSASAGESGDSMTHKFRHANNMSGKNFNELFIYRSDILRENLGYEDTVVLIDDFIGSGKQACDSWNLAYGELLAEVGTVYLITVAATMEGLEKVRSDTEMNAVANISLSASENVLSNRSNRFTDSEKAQIEDICRKVDKHKPKGFGNCGLLVVFSHSCPNNSLPILHRETDNWYPLFRRHE